MDTKPLIELVNYSINDDGQKWDILLKRCLNSSESDLDEFFNKLSRSFDVYLTKLQAFISHLRNRYLQVAPNNKITLFNKFISSLITVVIMKNLQKCDIFGFGELLHNCIELLWWAGNKDNNKPDSVFQIIKNTFSAIMNADGVLEILISEVYGFRCLKRILFDFNMINRIERIELLKAVDVVAAFVEKCPEHEDDLSLSKEFSVYKACTALLETLENQSADQILLINRKNSLPPMLNNMTKIDNKEKHWNRRRTVSDIHNNLVPLSIKDEQHLALLKMTMPQKPSDLPHFLQALEQRKIDSFRVNIYIYIYFFCLNQT